MSSADCDEVVKYRPPSPTMATYINLISGIFAGHFTTETFREGVRRCFISVGLAPYNADGDYLQYVSHANAYATVKCSHYAPRWARAHTWYGVLVLRTRHAHGALVSPKALSRRRPKERLIMFWLLLFIWIGVPVWRRRRRAKGFCEPR